MPQQTTISQTKNPQTLKPSKEKQAVVKNRRLQRRKMRQLERAAGQKAKISSTGVQSSVDKSNVKKGKRAKSLRNAPPKMISYIEAIRLALDKILAKNPEAFLYGQDIGAFGGAFKASEGLFTKYHGRVKDAPISEDAIVGFAIGAALAGKKPIIEMQFADFASIAFNQIANHAATCFWRTGSHCPLVIRLPVGGTPGGGPFHCQSTESIYAHYPGLDIYYPSTANDAHFMLLEAFANPNPVIFCEHKFLYQRAKTKVLSEDEYLPIGRKGAAQIARVGKHISIVCYGAMRFEALEAAHHLHENDGIEAEVIDVRSVKPLDDEVLLASIARTGRVLVVAESFPFSSVASEIMATISSGGFHLMDAPPRKLCALDTPIPFHPNLWDFHRPNAKNIYATVTEMLSF